MFKKALYTWIGANALTLDFVTHPRRAQNWLDKAERRGSKIAAPGEQRLRRLSRRTESRLESLRNELLATVGLVERRAERAEHRAEASAKSTARKVRRRAPRARVTRRTRRAGTRRVASTTLSVAS